MAKKLDKATLKAVRRLIEDCCDNCYELEDEAKADAHKVLEAEGFDSHELQGYIRRIQMWGDFALAFGDLLEDFEYKVEQSLK